MYSEDCVRLVKESEGLRLRSYIDAAGFATIGYGHKITPADGELITVTQYEANDLLEQDLIEAWDAVRRQVRVDITQGQTDALVSFTFNLGENRLAKSTLLKLINGRQFENAANEFRRWTMAGGKELPGLVTRRNNERELFIA